jgi:hypothetical protein
MPTYRRFPQLFILVEVFQVCIPKCYVRLTNNPIQSLCGISVVEDYYHWHKFNIMETRKLFLQSRCPTKVAFNERQVTSRSTSSIPPYYNVDCYPTRWGVHLLRSFSDLGRCCRLDSLKRIISCPCLLTSSL